MITILVTGGTGRLGRHVAPRLRTAGHRVRVLTRHATEGEPGIEYLIGDLTRHEGVEAALEGADIVVHCAASTKFAENKAMLRTLVQAASRAGVRHLVGVSVIGADRVPVRSRVDRMTSGYFELMVDVERMIAESGLPWTTLRATQFFDASLLAVRMMAKLPVIPVPSGYRFQPIDAAEVAERMAELAVGPPAGLADELAGPRVYTMKDLIRTYLQATHKRRLLLPVRVPSGAAQAIRAGAILAPDRAVGRRTWEEFLAETVAATGMGSSHVVRQPSTAPGE